MAQSSSRSNRVTKFKSLIAYYGGKSKIAHLYPAPQSDYIVEPFAGGAAYSLLHYNRKVILFDSDPITARIWEFLLSPNALTTFHKFFPATVSAGMKVSELLDPTAPEGMLRFLQAEANAGTQGARGVHNQITKFGAASWHRIIPKLEQWLPRIQHWRFHCVDYTQIPNMDATWFIDPPYNNVAGRRYRQQVSDYDALGKWCIERWGQIIVCENYGATWLPFEPLVPRRGVMSSYQTSRAMEGIYAKSEAR